MEKTSAHDNLSNMYGIDFYVPDAPHIPTKVALTDGKELAWFSEHPADEWAAGRLLCQLKKQPPNIRAEESLPYSDGIVDHAIWSPDDYRNLWFNAAGGSAALLDDPWRFILQTPNDGGSFCSFAISRHGHRVKGVYTYSDPLYDPERILAAETINSGWRGSGLQIISLPQAFLRIHSAQMARQLTSAVDQISHVERALTEPTGRNQMQDFAPLNRTLHACNTVLIDLERRSKFESSVVKSIECMLASKAREYHYSHETPWPPLAVQKNAIASRSYDFETLPRRIQDARATISNLILQRNQEMNLEIAESSRRIAEATMSDSASMKTIAILTMVFLPGTAVASFFSMTMFNWQADSGQALASHYLWVYFLVAVPSTAMVLAVWWTCTKRRERRLLREDVMELDFEDSTEAVQHGSVELMDMQDSARDQTIKEDAEITSSQT